MSYKSANSKNAIHGFFVALATTVAEPGTILPLIIHHFTQNSIIVGLYVAILRSGPSLVSLFAAFYAQSLEKVMPFLKIVFVFRVLSWFSIGFFILAVGDKNPSLTLFLIGVGLFVFSFSAGFGGIYFKEIIAKIFSKEERGRSMSNKQFFASLGSLLSGGIAGLVLQNFKAPDSYAYLFMGSAILMSIGLFSFATIKEPIKHNIQTKENSFSSFLKNSYNILKNHHQLRIQISITLLGFSFLLSLPFVILKAKESMELSGWIIGSFVTIQMLGSMVGNLLLWKRLTHNYLLMMQIALGIFVTIFLIALFAHSQWEYLIFFLGFGVARDGFRNADMNLLFEIASESKRPVYMGISSTVTSLGFVYSIVGGVMLKWTNFGMLFSTTVILLFLALYLTSIFKINNNSGRTF